MLPTRLLPANANCVIGRNAARIARSGGLRLLEELDLGGCQRRIVTLARAHV
ncbi:MAG: hypothetical protein JWM25_1438 [Thermoleophilia bacterium]|nr:hypothetical protein [Thermoleophilia bacterium]